MSPRFCHANVYRRAGGDRSGHGFAADEADDRVEAAVKKLDGSVVRRNDLAGNPIVNVILSMSKVKDDDLKMLGDLKSLSSIQLYRTDITDAGLSNLAASKA